MACLQLTVVYILYTQDHDKRVYIELHMYICIYTFFTYMYIIYIRHVCVNSSYLATYHIIQNICLNHIYNLFGNSLERLGPPF